MPERDRVVIAAYDPHWPIHFETERAALANLFRDVPLRIKHIGSTAVPGLGAKPIIDIMLGVDALGEVEIRIPPIEALGYEYVQQFEDKLPERRYFRKMARGCRTHHLHCVELTSGFWSDHLAFRDLLRADSELARDYHQLKCELAERYGEDLDTYAAAKTNFIQTAIRRTRL